MKKIIIFLCVFAMFIPALCIGTSAADPITIWKTATSPKIDCVLDESYKLIADSAKNPKLFHVKTKAGIKNHVEIYACWDKDSLYLFVKADCNDPHIAYQDDAAKHWIFNAHYLMTALCPDDSTQAKYKGTADDKGGWEWGALNSANYLYEWTTIFDSKAKQKARTDHFGKLGDMKGYEYETKSEKGYDIYEQKIPMKMLVTSVMKSGMTPSVGSVFGIGTGIGFTDVGTDYKEDKQDSANFSDYFEGNKNLNGLILCKLGSNLNEPAESSESSIASSASSTSKNSSSVASSSEIHINSLSESKTSSSASNSNAAAASSDDTANNGFEYWWLVITGSAVVIAAVAGYLIYKKRK